MSGFDASDPWSWDAFAPPNPHVKAPEPFKPAPRVFPEQERLFQVQKNALKAAQLAQDLERQQLGERTGSVETMHTCRECGHRERVVIAAPRRRGPGLIGQLADATEDTYRVIRSYLDKYVTQSGGQAMS